LWLQAIFLIASSKKGISSNQLHRTLGVTLKTAWFMSHRIREAMRRDGVLTPMGGPDGSGIVEADETYHGRAGKKSPMNQLRGVARKHKDQRPKRAIIALVERGGSVRSFHAPSADKG